MFAAEGPVLTEDPEFAPRSKRPWQGGNQNGRNTLTRGSYPMKSGLFVPPSQNKTEKSKSEKLSKTGLPRQRISKVENGVPNPHPSRWTRVRRSAAEPCTTQHQRHKSRRTGEDARMLLLPRGIGFISQHLLRHGRTPQLLEGKPRPASALQHATSVALHHEGHA